MISRQKATLVFAAMFFCLQSAFSSNAVNSNVFNEVMSSSVQGIESIAAVKAQLPGDLDNDGKRSLMDVMLMVEMILDNNPNNLPISVADLNGDEGVSLIDIMMLVDIILNGDDSIVFDVDGGDTGIGYGGPGTGPAHTNQNNTWEE